MTGTVELPVWFVGLAGLLAIIGLIDRLLTPAVRWFLHRRVNRMIDELNTRLQLKIRPFELTGRRIVIDRVAHDPEVLVAAEEYARANDMPVELALDRATRYAREIVPAFNAYAYFRIGTRLARWLATSLYRVRLGYSDSDALRGVDPQASVVFVMNHRSNMDYVLVTYLASASTALSYAVGEWARVPVLQTLIRSMGAYFIRRDTGDPLYRRVLASYVRMATEAGVSQAIFPEGGLSRDGLLRPARLGLISYIVAAHEHSVQDTIFIPVGLNYDRVLEDRSLMKDAAGDAPITTIEKTRTTLAFLGRNLRLRLAGRWHRFGYASVSFGKPVSLNGFLKRHGVTTWQTVEESRRAELTRELGDHLMQAVGRLVPVLPVSLVALALVEAGETRLDRLALKARVDALMDHLLAKGAHVHVPRADRDYEVTVGLRMLTMRHIVREDRRGYLHTNSDDQPLLAFYANAIRHLL